MKKFFALMAFLLIISAQVSAMRLELYPQPIGKIFFDGETFQIDGATQIEGDFKKGVVLFGEDFYFNFDADRIYNRFGSRDKKNSVEVDTYGETEIYQIANSAGSDLFLLKKISDYRDAIKVFGLRDYKWIMLLDALDFREKFNIGENFRLSKIFTEENRIIFRYTLQNHFVDVVCRWHAVNQKFYNEVIER